MKIIALLTMTFWTVKTFIKLKLDLVCEGIKPSRYLKLTNLVMTVRIPDFWRRNRCVILQQSLIQGSNNLNVNVRNYDISEDALPLVSGF